MGKKKTNYYILAFLLMISLIFGGASKAKNVDMRAHFDLFATVLNYIKAYYVEEVDYNKLFVGACKGMVSQLDPYSSFMMPDIAEELKIETQGEFGGLGIEITIKNGWLTVITPIEGTPAFKEGIMAGDIIVEIDGKSTKGITLSEAVKKLRGKAGTKVTLTIVREGVNHTLKFTITRDRIKLKSVQGSKIIDKKSGIGYLRITNFQMKTAMEVRKAIEKLKKEGMKGLIIDLRFNPGGLLSSAIEVSDLFIEKGVIVSTKGRNSQQRAVAFAHREGTYKNLPLVVLINNYSASASEIVAGAIQDLHRGIIVGEKSYGKGSVQTVIEIPIPWLNNRKASLKLTTAKYYTPSDKCIDGDGIHPDILVPTTPEEEIKILEERRKEHIIKNNNTKKTLKENTSQEEKYRKIIKELKRNHTNSKKKKEKFIDRQLITAINVLKALLLSHNLTTG